MVRFSDRSTVLSRRPDGPRLGAGAWANNDTAPASLSSQRSREDVASPPGDRRSGGALRRRHLRSRRRGHDAPTADKLRTMPRALELRSLRDPVVAEVHMAGLAPDARAEMPEHRAGHASSPFKAGHAGGSHGVRLVAGVSVRHLRTKFGGVGKLFAHGLDSGRHFDIGRLLRSRARSGPGM